MSDNAAMILAGIIKSTCQNADVYQQESSGDTETRSVALLIYNGQLSRLVNLVGLSVKLDKSEIDILLREARSLKEQYTTNNYIDQQMQDLIEALSRDHTT